MKIERRFTDVQGRRVHYRRAGSGLPVVMLHGSPGNSEMLGHEIAVASEHFTVFALDTPGFGDSDPLPGSTLTMTELAAATAAAMTVLGLPPCPVYGTHTGAVIAIELGIGWPEQVTGLLLEGLPIFSDEEIEIFFQGYFAPMVPDPLGGHLISTWIRFRDQFTWFPWTSRNVTRLNPVDRPTAEDIHHWVMMFYRSCRTYSPAYRAACYYGTKAFVAAEALDVPAIYTASAEDMLFPHLDRLPPLKSFQRIEKLPYDPEKKFVAITSGLRSLPQAQSVALTSSHAFAGNSPALQFINTTSGQTFVRCYGNPADRAVVLLHDAPGSGLAMDEMARSIAKSHFVIVPDLPGTGESDPPTGEVLEACAVAVEMIVEALGLSAYTLAAKGCGCAVAAILAERGAPGLSVVLLEDVPPYDPVRADAIAPELPLCPEGTHWIKAWLMVRDAQIYTPWFDGRIAAQRSEQGNFDATWLHDQTFALMQARTSYHLLPRAALAFDHASKIARARVPVSEGFLADLLHATD